ncbi:MAG: GAF domain-containing protein [Anaerolineae bacterium]|nr:GAF domain-containing protein [Anaerolineae bacterium]
MERTPLLHRISDTLYSDLTLEQILANVLALAVSDLGASDGSIILLDDSGQVADYVLAREELAPAEAREAVERVLSHGLAGWVVRHQQATIVFDTQRDERWILLPGDTLVVRSAIATPLLSGEVVRGVLILVHPEPQHFNEQQLQLLTSVARHATIALDNALLLMQAKRRLHELSLFNEIGQAIATLDLDEVLTLITRKTAEALRVERCALFLLDESAQELVLRAADNPGWSGEFLGLRLPLEARPQVADAIARQEPVEIRDVFADERLRDFWPQARRLGLKAHLAVPLIVKGKAIGAISLDRTGVRPPFTPEDVNLCQAIAHQAASAIDNARLYQEARRRAEQLRLVNDVSRQISGILDVNRLLRKVVYLIRDNLDCHHVSVALVEGDELVFRADVGSSGKEKLVTGLRLRVGSEGICGWVAQAGVPLLVPDVSKDSRYYPWPTLSETRCELAVPLKVQERVIGVLDVQSTAVEGLDEDDLTLLQALAAQISVAVENARLFSTIREERAKLAAIINGTEDAILVTDEQGRVLIVNAAGRQALASDVSDSLAGLLLHEITDNEALLALWQRASSRGESCSAEVPLPDGRTLYATLNPIAGIGWVAVMHDITYLKELDKLKSDFVSTVSHDLRSPLQTIQTSAELLPRMGYLNADQREAVDRITRVVSHMSALVKDLLDIGRIEAGVDMEMAPCSLWEVILQGLESWEPVAKDKGLLLTAELPPSLPLVLGNEQRLGQVVSNLLGNAIKYTFQGQVTIRAFTQGDEVIVTVTDTGVGIAPQHLPHVFEKFYRARSATTNEVEGTGLGLAIVKSVVEHHGGRVWVESEVAQGSTFGFALPVIQEGMVESADDLRSPGEANVANGG